jgi:hypothetical protein
MVVSVAVADEPPWIARLLGRRAERVRPVELVMTVRPALRTTAVEPSLLPGCERLCGGRRAGAACW